MINDPKNLYRPNMDIQIANASKRPLFGGSFCIFKIIAQIYHIKDPEISDQRPKKLMVF